MDDDLDWYSKLADNIQNENMNRFPKVGKLNQKACEESTEMFARYRLHYFSKIADEIDPERKFFNPILDYFVKEYPLPLGLGAISECYTRRGWDDSPREIIPSPIVERLNAYAGLAKRFESKKSVGWFLGLVQPYNLFTMPDNEKDSLTGGEVYYWAHHTEFVFVEGMSLLEGKFDKPIIRQLEDYENSYNENMLGTFTVGRPRYDPEDYLGPARSIIRRYPDILQKDLVKRIGCDERTFRRWREIADFKTFREFKNSVLKK